jgi:3-isopropylmalate dehydrogenase
MTTGRSYAVACLSGNGIGPELMGEASRAVARVSRLHGFRVAETHPPFGGEAVTQSGHALPASTRRATLVAQAILVASVEEPALAGVESELDLQARVDRVGFGSRHVLTILSPLGAAVGWTLERAFDVAASSHGRVTLVGRAAEWRSIARPSGRHDGLLVDELAVGTAVRRLALEPERFDVVVTEQPLAEVLSSVVAQMRHGSRVAACGHLADTGPGVFAPVHTAAPELAGQGVANPASMLLAAALMLGEGLGERRAAETLTGAVLAACSGRAGTPDMVTNGVGATTREFANAVLAELANSLTNAEFYREAVA